jgi:hypothetical protein
METITKTFTYRIYPLQCHWVWSLWYAPRIKITNHKNYYTTVEYIWCNQTWLFQYNTSHLISPGQYSTLITLNSTIAVRYGMFTLCGRHRDTLSIKLYAWHWRAILIMFYPEWNTKPSVCMYFASFHTIFCFTLWPVCMHDISNSK